MNWKFFDTRGQLKVSIAGSTGTASGDLSGTYPNPAVKQSSTAFALPGDIAPTALAADTDNWAPASLSGASVIRADLSADVRLTGITGGADGRVLVLENISSTYTLTLVHDSTSTAGNRFYLKQSTVAIAPLGTVMFIYDSTNSRWVMQAGGDPVAANPGLTGQDASIWFGTGGDGAIHLDTTSIPACDPRIAQRTTSTDGYVWYQLMRDVHCTSLLIDAGVRVWPRGFRIYCRGTVTVNGGIAQNGVDGNGSTAFPSTSGGMSSFGSTNMYSSNSGGYAADGAGSATQAAQGTQVQGGLGGSSTEASTGTDGGSFAYYGVARVISQGGSYTPRLLSGAAPLWRVPEDPGAFSTATPPGGGAGPSHPRHNGGSIGTGIAGGGGPGNVIQINAASIVVGSAGTLTAKGGDATLGGNSGFGSDRSYGGPGGGGGGVIVLVYRSYVNNGTVTVAGGVGCVGGANAAASGLAQVPFNSVTTNNRWNSDNWTRTTDGAGLELWRPNSNVNITPPLWGAAGCGNIVLFSVIGTRAAGASAAPTVTGWGGTWSSVGSVAFNTGATPTKRLAVFWSRIPTTFTQNKLFEGFNVTWAAEQDSTIMQIFAVGHCNDTTPIVQTVTATGDANTTAAATLAAGVANNMFMAINGQSGAGSLTSVANGTILADFTTTTNKMWEWHRQGSVATQPSTTLGAAADWGVVAFEVASLGNVPPPSGASGQDGSLVRYQVA